MNEIYQQIVGIIYGIWRRRWYMLGATTLICSVGWIAVATIPNSYTSTARIYVDTETMLRPLMRGIAVEVNVMRQVDVMRRTLMSRPNLEKVIRRSDLDLISSTDEEVEDVIDNLEKDIRIRDEGANLFRVEYESGHRALSDPQNAEMARRVVQNLLTIFVESNLGANRQDLASARRFIDQQIGEYERQLEEAERRRADFERVNLGMMPGDENFLTQLKNARSALGRVEAALNETNLARMELERQLKEKAPFVKVSGQIGPSMMSGMDGNLPERIRVLQQKLDALKSRGYTDKHPDVVISQQQLDNLRQQYLDGEAAAESAEADAGPGVGEVPNPVYEKIDMQLSATKTELAVLSGRRDAAIGAVQALEDRAQSVPLIEAEMSKLNRDYEILKSNYEALLGRRESARMAQDIETNSNEVQFSVVDPPTEPFEPSNPNRPLLLSLVLVVGLGAGIVLSVVLTQLKSTYLTANSLRDAFGLPVLGSVTAIMSERDIRQRKVALASFAMTLAVLLLAYGTLMAIELIRNPLA